MLLRLQTLTHVILTCSVFLQGIIRPIKHMGGNSLMQVAHNRINASAIKNLRWE